ncbi:MAG: hypothetical protein OXG78_01805 [Chloroflexi bacterium]|nr:hypothetical protein [Chloroflexota bacterium]
MSRTPRSWIWADEASGGVKGARMDADAGVIEWVDQPGCACGDATTRQTLADFLANGPLESPPEDALDEMRKALSIDSRLPRR